VGRGFEGKALMLYAPQRDLLYVHYARGVFIFF
jgi:hypothetical protein